MPTESLLSQTASFRKAASAFCGLLEHGQWSEPAALLQPLQGLLPELYAAAASLPRLDGTEAANEDLDLPEESIRSMYGRISEALGPQGLYWDVFDPSVAEPDPPVAGSLPDDLTDIYRDLRRGFAFWERGHDTDFTDAVWNWRFFWEVHWGAHAADAIRAIHWHLDKYHQAVSIGERPPVPRDDA